MDPDAAQREMDGENETVEKPSGAPFSGESSRSVETWDLIPDSELSPIELKARQRFQRGMRTFRETSDEAFENAHRVGTLIADNIQAETPGLGQRERERAFGLGYSRKRAKTPPRIKDTPYEQTKDFAYEETGRWYQAQKRVNEQGVGNISVKEGARAVGAYGLDGISALVGGADRLTFGAVSKASESIDALIDSTATGARRMTRDFTGNQRIAQNVGEAITVAGSVMGPKKITAAKEAAQLAEGAKLAKTAKKAAYAGKSEKLAPTKAAKPSPAPVPAAQQPTPNPTSSSKKPQGFNRESPSQPKSPRSPQASSTAPPGVKASSVNVEKTTSGRAGKQKKLKELANDDKLGSADRGWIKQEQNAIKRKSSRMGRDETLRQQKHIRVPPTKELAHKRGKAAKDGFGYEHSDLQDIDLHKLQHKHEGYK